MNSDSLDFSPLNTQAAGGPSREISLKIIGVGGAGSNVVDRLKMESPKEVALATLNTDSQALAESPVEEKILIGSAVTRGLGAGGDPELGRLAATADQAKIEAAVRGCDLVFLLAGMGGGTGTGAAPIVAETASRAGALVIAFVTMPFTFEGQRRQKQAEEGLADLRKACDAVIPLPNDMLLQEADDDASVLDAFAQADSWIARAVHSIWSMLYKTGLINVDFAALRGAFAQRGGKTLFGLGNGSGPEAATKALDDLKLCPLLHTPEFSRRADRLLVNIIGGPDLSLARIHEIMSAVNEDFGREAHVVLGAVIDDGWREQVEICVIGTTDVGAKTGSTRRRELPSRTRTAPAPTVRIPLAAVARAETAAGGESAAQAEPELGLAGPPTQQEEFPFEGDSRGRFGETDRTVVDGEDLDAPTFVRRGVRIHL
jgi:cell division protein FtsZ